MGLGEIAQRKDIIFKSQPRFRRGQPASNQNGSNMEVFKNSTSKPYYLLNSKELDIMIYYHKKYFEEMKRAIEKQKQDAIIHEDSHIIEQAKSLLQNPSRKNMAGNFFYTNVDIDKPAATPSQDHQEEKPSNQQEELIENQELEDQIQEEVRKRSTKFKSSTRLEGRDGEQRRRGRELPDSKWMKQRKGPNFLLDFRREKPRGRNGVQADQQYQNEKLKSVYHFVPTLKPPRNPQMRKIEAYLGDCDFDFVKNLPMVKIPSFMESGIQIANTAGEGSVNAGSGWILREIKSTTR